MTTKKPKNIDAYIANFPVDIREMLERLRELIKKTAQEAEETISYGMPAFKLNGILVWFAAHTKHIGFYPASSAIEVFKDELKNYKTSKGAIQFPFEKPIPANLVKKIVKYRINENMEKTKSKMKKKYS